MEFKPDTLNTVTPEEVQKVEPSTLSSLEIGKLLEKIRAGLTGSNGREIAEEIEAILNKKQ